MSRLPKPPTPPVRRNVLLALGIAQHSYYQGVARYAREHHWHLVPDMVYTGKIPHRWRGDGIISFLGQRNDLVDFVLSASVPVVEISLVRSEIDLPRVEGDNELIGRMAAEHFLERGFEHFAWAPFADDAVNTERRQGFTRRLRRAGFGCERLPPAHARESDPWEMDWIERRQQLTATLRALPLPVGVLCYNDCIAADVISACEEAGLKVPEQVAVLGVDNDPFICESISVPLSSVWHDLERMAYEAAALLDHLMAGGRAPREVRRIPPKGLVVRKSTDILAVPNRHVASALRYVWENFTNPLLSVPDVVTATGISRRPLEKAFRQHLARSIHSEIARVRMEMAVDLFTRTKASAGMIARDAGFARPNHLFRSFRKKFGMSPKQFRQALAAAPARGTGGASGGRRTAT